VLPRTARRQVGTSRRQRPGWVIFKALEVHVGFPKERKRVSYQPDQGWRRAALPESERGAVPDR